MLVQPYLLFNGRCEEAIEFYREVLGAEVTMMLRFKDSPEPVSPDMVPPGTENKIMHASLTIGESIVHATDGPCQGPAGFQGFSLSITVPDSAKAEEVFAALGTGGKVQMPMHQTFFAQRFGMVVDRFGVTWNVLAQA